MSFPGAEASSTHGNGRKWGSIEYIQAFPAGLPGSWFARRLTGMAAPTQYLSGQDLTTAYGRQLLWILAPGSQAGTRPGPHWGRECSLSLSSV